MARYTGPACRLCRREGTKLYLKGSRCTSGACSFDVREKAGAPGAHGTSRKKVGEYGMQLREKQKAKRYYGVLERQFRNYYEMAVKKEGMTGANLLCILETRLDNVVYRMGLAASRKEARQLVCHGHFTLNGKRADIASILVRPGDVIALRENSRDLPKFKALIENFDAKNAPKWLEVDTENVTAKAVAAPTRDDIDFPFTEQLIVELYSK